MNVKYLHLSLVALACVAMPSCDDDDNGSSSGDAPYVMSDSPRFPSKSAKRGVAYGFQLPDVDMALLSPGITWFYNWGNSTSNEIFQAAQKNGGGIEYLPMCWNNSYNVASITSAASTWGSGYLLAYNEPNLTDQANMTPAQAAEQWGSVVSLAKANNLKIVSPAMNYGTLAGYGDPTKWLDEFFSLIDASEIAAISVHCYMPNAAALKGYIDMFAKYGKPIWLTEFCAWDGFNGGEVGQREYLSEAVNYLEANPSVERYAWFIPRYTGGNDPKMQLLSGEELTDRGQAYVGASSQDETVYCVEGQTVQASRFVRCNASDCASVDSSYVSSPHYRPTTDEQEGIGLDLYHFGRRQWLEYQVEIGTAGDFDLQLRGNCLASTTLAVAVDGEPAGEVNLTSTNAWDTYHATISLAAGKHTLRFSVAKGNTALNWFRLVRAE